MKIYHILFFLSSAILIFVHKNASFFSALGTFLRLWYSFVMKQRIFFLTIIFLSALNLFASAQISDFTEEKIKDFLTIRIELKSADDADALEKIDEIQSKVFSELAENAVDLEQEKLILESFYFMEKYEHALDPEKNRDSLRKEMKVLMKKIFSCIDSRGEKNASKWLYNVCGDVTSYYMTRSIKATFFYGLKVKDMYEKAVKIDSTLSTANVSLGNWFFYAPRIFGGGKDKAFLCYKAALEGATTAGEQYIAYQSLSQLFFELKDMNQCEKNFKKARELKIGTKELDLMQRCNDAGYSIFQYRRNRAGIDEKIPEAYKDEEDK